MDGERTRPDLVEAVSLDRERRAFAMRLNGATFAAIGKALGLSTPGAYQAYKRALRRGREELAEETADHIALDAARLDKLIHAKWKSAVAGDNDAIDRVLRLLERRARLLGLDAASRTELTGKDGGPLEIADPEARKRRIRELLAKQRADADGLGGA